MSSHGKPPETAGPLHAYLTGAGPDGRGRRIEDVLAMPDDALEVVHDYIQWLFPLPTRSMAQPDAPVLDAAEIDAIRADPRSVARLEQAAARMLRFYETTGHWLTPTACAFSSDPRRRRPSMRPSGPATRPPAAPSTA